MNKSCQISIIETEKNNKKYNEISAIMALAKTMEPQVLVETLLFDFSDNATWNRFKDVPKWIQEKIKKYQTTYQIGLHGPDILFYVRPFHKNRFNQMAHRLHREEAAGFFERGRKIYQKTGNEEIQWQKALGAYDDAHHASVAHAGGICRR